MTNWSCDSVVSMKMSRALVPENEGIFSALWLRKCCRKHSDKSLSSSLISCSHFQSSSLSYLRKISATLFDCEKCSVAPWHCCDNAFMIQWNESFISSRIWSRRWQRSRPAECWACGTVYGSRAWEERGRATEMSLWDESSEHTDAAAAGGEQILCSLCLSEKLFHCCCFTNTELVIGTLVKRQRMIKEDVL